MDCRHDRRRLLLACAGALATAAGTAAAGTVETPLQAGGRYAVRVTSLKERRRRGTVLQRYDFSCGSAALATLLTHHYNRPLDEQQVFEAMYLAGDQARIREQGFSLLDMKHYLESLGYAADGFEASLAALAEAGLPAIALIDDQGWRHFVVVKGLRGGRVLLGDPAGGVRALGESAFEALWANRILFVIGSHRAQARFNLAADWAVMPRAPLAQGLAADGLGGIVLPKYGAGDF